MEFYATYEELSNDLLHSGKGHDDNPPGRGSGRYAWGSGDRPYQDLSKAARKSLINKTSKDFTSTTNKIRKKESKKKNSNKYTKQYIKELDKKYDKILKDITLEELQKLKKEAIDRASAKELLYLRERNILSAKDVNEAMSRIDWDKKLASYVKAEEGPTLIDQIDKIADMTKKVTSWTNTGIEAVKTVQKAKGLIDNSKDKKDKKDKEDKTNKTEENKTNIRKNKGGSK